jgi:uncharacterized protein YcbK (DUF882 family)
LMGEPGVVTRSPRVSQYPTSEPMLRRNLLVGSVGSAFFQSGAWGETCVWPPPNWEKGGFPSRRWVKIISVSTGEHFNDLYVHDGVYSIDAIKRFSWTVRDFSANESKLLDPRLMDLLFILHWKYCKDEIQVISGYRSGKTSLHSERPILDEQHRNARALDIRLPGMDSEQIVKDFEAFIFGGVSSFPALNFLHVDMGPLRKASTERLSDQGNQGPNV